MSGTGFPQSFRVELASPPDFSDARVFYEEPHLARLAGGGAWVRRADPVSGRFVRITLRDGIRDVRKDHAEINLAEIELLENGQTVSGGLSVLKPGNEAETTGLSLVTDGVVSEGMECCDVYHSAEDCTEAFQSANPPQVDVILLDLKLPGKSGMSLIPLLRKAAPEAGILVLTSNDDYRTTLEAIQLGVVGYVLKDTPVAALRQAILHVHEGGTVIDPQLSRLVLKAFQDKGTREDNPLSKRERQVLELMAMGYAKKDVANELGLSYSAVALDTANIYEKLQVPNIAAAVSTAIRKGLI